MSFKPKDKYELKHLVFDRLKPKHKHLLKFFQTYQTELKDFLVEDTIHNQQMCVSNTYLVFDKLNFLKWGRKKEKPTLLGYVTILTDSITLDGPLKEKLREKGIGYKALPALKIGRLCVDERFERMSIGKNILLWTIKRVTNLNKNVACRFITLEAKRHKDRKMDSLYFYKRFGFEPLITKEKTKNEILAQNKGITPMFLDLYHVITVLKAQQNF